MSECHKMVKGSMDNDGYELWSCPFPHSDTYYWKVKWNDKGTPKKVIKYGSSDGVCHSFGYIPDDLTLSMGVK